MPKQTAQYWIEKLQLQPHPEGGYFKEIYRSDETLPQSALPDRYNTKRTFATSIYFLLEKEQVSHFHRITSDEIWHFYDGCSLTIHQITEEGALKEFKLGLDYDNGESPQVMMEKNCWFAAEINDKSSFTLIGCTVAPGFEFSDFELAKRDELLETYGFELIKRFTKP